MNPSGSLRVEFETSRLPELACNVVVVSKRARREQVVEKCAVTFAMLSTLEASEAVFPDMLAAVVPGKVPPFPFPLPSLAFPCIPLPSLASHTLARSLLSLYPRSPSHPSHSAILLFPALLAPLLLPRPSSTAPRSPRSA